MSAGQKFSDLGVRLLSAVVMAGVGLSAIWAGGVWFLGLLVVVAALMVWELQTMLAAETAPIKRALVSLVAALAVLRVGFDSSALALSGLMMAPVLGMVLLPRDRGLFVVYTAAILFAVVNLFWLRTGAGLAWMIWIVSVVVAADIGGYFFGRIIGGAKILPRISPKKTWSGTLGGLFMAALVGVAFMIGTSAGPSMVLLSIVTAFASQCGDVTESALKRHRGVKDSSNLIPGHGGVLDRFDAMIGASLFVLIAALQIGLPLGGTL